MPPIFTLRSIARSIATFFIAESLKRFRSTPSVLFSLTVAAIVPAYAQTLMCNKADRSGPIEIQADHVDGEIDQTVKLSGAVDVVQDGIRLQADRAVYIAPEQRVQGSGHVIVNECGAEYRGAEFDYQPSQHHGYVLKPEYRLQLKKNLALGHAERIDFEDENHTHITEGTYTSCTATHPDWYLQAKTLDLDTSNDTGRARHSTLYFKDVPVLGLPLMTFPLTDTRKTGFLTPSYGVSSRGGVEVLLPYYWNIAPNYDATLYPRIISQRGLQLGMNGRYLTRFMQGETNLEILPEDRQTHSTRYAFGTIHQQDLTHGLNLTWNINGASDDNYPTDFSRSITTSVQRQLLRDLALNYTTANSATTLRASGYQILQDPLAPIARPYDRLPQFLWRYARQDQEGFNWSNEFEYTNFRHPDLVQGQRVVNTPRISYPILAPGYFFTPKLSANLASYQLDNSKNFSNPQNEKNFSRALPTFSADGGLIFERDTHILNRALRQTLEPRLFYVYTPYLDQSKFPNFDSADADFNFTQIFSENIFSGQDRIADANQLTAGVVSRFIDSEAGDEKMRFALAQRYYFTDQRVYLSQPRNGARSDILVGAGGNLNSKLAMDAALQYNVGFNQLYRANYAVHWQPAPKKTLNVGYRYLRDSLQQVEVSGQWPINLLSPRWYGVGQINYSMNDRRVVENLAGLEYKADCWIFRVVAQRFATTAQTATTSMYLQLELLGLSKLGSNPLEALRRNIPGYQPLN